MVLLCTFAVATAPLCHKNHSYKHNVCWVSSSSSSSSSFLFSSVRNNSSNSTSSESETTAAEKSKDTTEEETIVSVPLGDPLPTDEHACSVSLPTWASVVGYEEGDVNVTSKLKCGYPRFVYHPYVLQLMGVVIEQYSTSTTTTTSKEDCLVLPTSEAALRCQFFLQQAIEGRQRVVAGQQQNQQQQQRIFDNALIEAQNVVTAGEDNDGKTRFSMDSFNDSSPGTTSRIRAVAVTSDDRNATPVCYAVLFPAETMIGMQAKAYWQHTGDLVSSRRAEWALKQLNIPISDHQRVTHQMVAPPATTTTTTTTPSYHVKYCGSCHESSSSSNSQEQCISYADQLKHRIAEWAGVNDDDDDDAGTSSSNVFLTASGMSSIYTCLRSSRRRQMELGHSVGGTSIVYGFPYLDTLKLCSRGEFCPEGVEFFGYGTTADLHDLQHLLEKTTTKQQQNQQSQNQQQQQRSYCALFTELPSNPLLQTPDLYQLRQLANEYNFLLIVDDTISNFLNVNLFDPNGPDAVCSSLTKLVSGQGDAMGGSVVVNPHTPGGQWMKQDLQRQYNYTTTNNNMHSQQQQQQCQGGLFDADAKALLENSADFEHRNAIINTNAEQLADWLHQHPDVQTVYYPKLSETSAHLYHQVQKGSNNYGGLLSMMLHPHMCQRTFYDALEVAKGPSLGTNFTLVCPYTLLAHYHELDFAMSYNVPPNLLRIAVGLEDFQTQLRPKFERALKKSRLYPKVNTNTNTRKQPPLSAAAAAAGTTTTMRDFSSFSSSTHSSTRRSFSSTSVAAPAVAGLNNNNNSFMRCWNSSSTSGSKHYLQQQQQLQSRQLHNSIRSNLRIVNKDHHRQEEFRCCFRRVARMLVR